LNLTPFSLVVVENSKKIISHLGFIPVQLTLQNSIISAIWHVSFFTLEEFRGKQLGTKTIDFSNKFGDVSMVLSGSDGTKKIYTNMNGKDLGLLKRYIKFFRKDKIELFTDSTINLEDSSIIKPNMGKLKRITRINKEYDYFWNKVKNRFPITINRTREYLNWRYFEHPFIDYHFLTLVIDNQLQGYAVIRLEDNNEEVKAARLVDLISEEAYDEILLNHVISYCHEKVDFIDFFCSGNFYNSSLISTGFFNNNILDLKIPTVFNPIDFKRRSNINFFCNNNNNNSYDIDIENIDNWYLVKSDSDQDRAN